MNAIIYFKRGSKLADVFLRELVRTKPKVRRLIAFVSLLRVIRPLTVCCVMVFLPVTA